MPIFVFLPMRFLALAGSSFAYCTFKSIIVARVGAVFIAYQSVACHESTNDAARTASEFSGEKVPIASCNPLSAIPRCS